MARAAKHNKTKPVPLAAFSYFTQRPCRLYKVGVKVMLAFREEQKWSDTAHPICCWKGVGWYQCLTSRIKLLYIDNFFLSISENQKFNTRIEVCLTHKFSPMISTFLKLSRYTFCPREKVQNELPLHVSVQSELLPSSRTNMDLRRLLPLVAGTLLQTQFMRRRLNRFLCPQAAGTIHLDALNKTAALPKILFANRRLKSCARSRTAEGVWRTVAEAVLLPLLKGPQSFHLRQ